MYKKIFIMTIILLLTGITATAKDIGNKINPKEYPHSDAVLPKKPENQEESIVIEGSVQKNMDLNLERCIELALGNNPQINAAFQDILASDARIKQVWSNYFPQVS